MNLVGWIPFGQVGLLQKTNRLSDTTLQGRQAESKDEAIRCNRCDPAVGFHESDDEVVVCVDLTGVDERTVDAHVENNILSIRGERRLPREYNKEGLDGAQVGFFARSFILATAVDPGNVCTTCKDGVLTITLTKAKNDKPKRQIARAAAA